MRHRDAFRAELATARPGRLASVAGMSTSRKPRPTAGATPSKTPAAGAPDARPARKSGSPAASRTSTADADRAAGGRSAASTGAGGRPVGGKAGRGAAGKGPAATAPPALVVGEVPVLVRVAGGLALAGALLRFVVPAFPIAWAGGRELGGSNLFDWVVLLPLAGAVGAAGVLCLLGRVPRLGLAVIMPAGTAAAGLGLRAAYLLDTADRGSQDLPLGIGSSFRYEAGAALTVQVVACGLLVAASVVGGIAWSRTVMEDEGGFDGWRPRFAALGLATGVLGTLGVGMTQATTSVPGAAPPALLEQGGTAGFGGLVLAGAVAVWAAVAATLRPRLATVGAFAGLAAALLTEALTTALLVVRSPVLGAGPGVTTETITVVLLAALAFAAWRVPPRRPRSEVEPAVAGTRV